jgi:hypothetical protein
VSADETAAILAGADGARILPRALRTRLEKAMVSGGGAEVVALQGIDGPRALSWALGQRLELALTRLPRRQVVMRFIPLVAAVAVASSAIAFGVAVLVKPDRPRVTQAIPLLPSTTPSAPVPAAPPEGVPPSSEGTGGVVHHPRAPGRGGGSTHGKPAPRPPTEPPPEPPPEPPAPSCDGTLAQLGAAIAEQIPPPLGGPDGVIATLTCGLP